MMIDAGSLPRWRSRDGLGFSGNIVIRLIRVSKEKVHGHIWTCGSSFRTGTCVTEPSLSPALLHKASVYKDSHSRGGAQGHIGN